MTKKQDSTPPRVLVDLATSEWFVVADPGDPYVDETSAKAAADEG
jgi:hypothetical protein